MSTNLQKIKARQERINKIQYLAEKQRILQEQFQELSTSIYMDLANPEELKIIQMGSDILAHIEDKMLEA